MVDAWRECNNIAALIYPASYSSEQESAWVDMSQYERIVILLNVGDIGTSVNADVEIATDDSGSGLHTLKSIAALTEAGGDDNSFVLIEVRAAEMVNPDGAPADNYRYIRLEVTPSGNCLLGATIIATYPRYIPVATTLIDEIVAD